MTARRRVLMVLDKAPQEGGVAVHVDWLSAALRNHGDEVETLRLHPRDGHGPPTAPGDSLRLPWTYGHAEGRRALPRLNELLSAWPPQLVHVHGSWSRLSSRLLQELAQRAPLVATLHDARPFCFLSTRHFAPADAACTRRCGLGCFTSGCVRPSGAAELLRWARRWRVDAGTMQAWQGLHHVVVPSRYLADLAATHGFSHECLHVVPHSTALPPALPDGAEHPAPPRLVFAGHLVPGKGLPELVNALALLRQRTWSVTVVGDGPLRATLQSQLQAEGLASRVHFVGHVPGPAALRPHLAGARLAVMPSTVPEAFGLAGLEALAAGLPVVSFGLGGVREWLHDGVTGFVAEPAGPAALAEAIARLLDDAALARRLGEQGRWLVATQFQPAQEFELLNSVYAAALRDAA